MRRFFALVYDDLGQRGEGVPQMPVLQDPLVVSMLALNRDRDDGLPMYTALRDLYLAEAEVGETSPWSFVLNMREALTFTRLAFQVEGIAPDRYGEAIRAAIAARMPEIVATRDPELTELAVSTLSQAFEILPAQTSLVVPERVSGVVSSR